MKTAYHTEQAQIIEMRIGPGLRSILLCTLVGHLHIFIVEYLITKTTVKFDPSLLLLNPVNFYFNLKYLN